MFVLAWYVLLEYCMCVPVETVLVVIERQLSITLTQPFHKR